MSGDHGVSAVSAAGKHRGALLAAFVLTALYMIVEAGAGIAFDSLALLSDAGHMLTDVAGLGMALAAVQFSQRRASRQQTYGLYRLEVLAALANSLLLFGVAAYVLGEALGRFRNPPDVPGAPLLVVATIGLVVNLVSFRLLRAGAEESLNVHGAYLEVLSDMLGSVGVIVAGIILITTGWPWADPIIGAGIGLFILPRTWNLAREALSILLEIAPREIDVAAVAHRLAAIAGVEAVHDLHVWLLTPGMPTASAHIVLREGASYEQVLSEATRLLDDEFGIHHATLQCETPDFCKESRKF